jgi:hypothetical protein
MGPATLVVALRADGLGVGVGGGSGGLWRVGLVKGKEESGASYERFMGFCGGNDEVRMTSELLKDE